MPVLGADQGERRRVTVDAELEEENDGTDRTARASTWHGSLMEGAGTITSVGSGAFGPLDVTWASRAEEPDGRTSPEELIAAAHAACFSMALSHGLAQGGTPPEQLDDVRDGDLRARDRDHEDRAHRPRHRPGIDEAAFLAAAEGAKENCPVSKALAGVPGDHASQALRLAMRRVSSTRVAPTRGDGRHRAASSTSSSAPTRRLQERMSDPAVYNDHREAADVGRRLKELEAPNRLADEWRQARADLEDARGDPELAEMAPELETRVARLEEELKLALVERDPADEKDVIVEVRQGVGGDEAALWAGDVYRMLTRYAERRGFKTETLSTSESEGGGVQGDGLRGQGRGRLLDLQVRGRDAPRPARARDRVAGADPHVDRDRRRHARGRGGRDRDPRERPARSTSTARPGRAGRA